MQRARSLRATPELARILSLPRRKLRKATAERHAAELTPLLALRRGVDLRAWQGQLLYEARKVGGCFASLPVGQGKTYPCEALPVLLESKRAILVLPAGLRSKTYADRRAFAGVWRVASPPPRLVSREELALEANAYLLDEINGTARGREDLDLIVIDEADEFSNWKSAAVRRLDRFITSKRKRCGFRSLRVVAMTGTPTRKSILGYWHILRWCLGDMAPVPESRIEAEMWAAVLDEAAPRAGFRPKPGPLGETIEQARAWYLDRLEHTPGVMLVDEDSAVDANGKAIPLTIRVRLAPDCESIDGAFDVLRTRWQSPSGEPVSDALSMNRIDGHLGCGLYTYWDPPPPKEWSEARQEIAAFIRKRIAETSHALRPLDTDAQVMRRHPAHPAVVEWKRVRKMFNPLKASRSRWVSDTTLRWVARWIAKHTAAGRVCVVWSGCVEFGTRLAEVARVPYYGPEGIEIKTGRELHAADPRRSMVCSWHANKRGFNLQDWREHAIVHPPPSAKYLEQVIGRGHRSPKPGVALHLTPVRFTILATSGNTIDGFRAAIREARFARNTAKSTQKILRADVRPVPTLPDSLRWVVKDEETDS